MVTASKLAAQARQRGSPESVSDAAGGHESNDAPPHGEAGDDSTTGSSEAAVVPLSFGEQLVLETYLRCRRRPFDPKRQEELAAPRRRAGATGSAEGASQDASVQQGAPQGKTLPRAQVDDLCSRLSQPKRPQRDKVPPGEELVLRRNELERAKREVVDVDAMLSRLAAPRLPRPPSPTSGERVVLMHKEAGRGRSVDHDRLAGLAMPTKRGASLASWGVRPDWRRPESGQPTPRERPGSQSTPRTEPQERASTASEGAAAAAARPGSTPSGGASEERAPLPWSAGGESMCSSLGLEHLGGGCSSMGTTGNSLTLGDMTADITPQRKAQQPSSFSRYGTPSWAGGSRRGLPDTPRRERGGSSQAEDVDLTHQLEGWRSAVDRHA
mmetsp:Transcript_56960/g.176722  ORF Transcript_56960/g.176722 Transcript_56960/m.176722 type:complete len:384 (-) Transcript_56960:105-1256(-)